MNVILLEDDDEVADGYEAEMSPETMEVSLNSVIGISYPKKMKLIGLIGGKEVVVMIDPGAIHNFVSLKVSSRGALHSSHGLRRVWSVAQ